MLRDEYKKFESQIVQASRKEKRKKFGHFNEITFTSKDWALINELNLELQVRTTSKLTELFSRESLMFFL